MRTNAWLLAAHDQVGMMLRHLEAPRCRTLHSGALQLPFACVLARQATASTHAGEVCAAASVARRAPLGKLPSQTPCTVTNANTGLEWRRRRHLHSRKESLDDTTEPISPSLFGIIRRKLVRTLRMKLVQRLCWWKNLALAQARPTLQNTAGALPASEGPGASGPAGGRCRRPVVRPAPTDGPIARLFEEPVQLTLSRA